jgi:primosomal protein N' (replication factor Y)
MPEAFPKIYVQVAVTLPISGTFTYTVTGELIEKVAVGKRVLVPFSGRKITAYILRIIPPEKREGVKDIITIIDAYPLFSPQMVEFFEWLSHYYLYPIGLVIKGALPTGLNVRTPDGTRMPSKGWLDRVGPLKMVFITVKKGATVDRSLFDRKRLPRNEDEFLEMVIKKKEVSLHEIKNAFSNGAYLVDKWVRKGFLKKTRRPVVRDIVDETLFISINPPPLNSKQTDVVERISEKLKGDAFFTYLLHGITDSGKTEVYYHAAKAAKELGKQSIIMVPEIALTVSMASLFKARFNNRVAILHSALSKGERYDQWIRIAKGDADVVIGARSALFAPLLKLGLIIVDEEHDLSYKQEEKFRYQARDAAIVRAKLSGAVVILGSGTPSVQSYQNAAIGKYGFLTMPKRILKRELPDIKVIDMAKFERSSAAQDESIMSPPLKEAIEENLTQKKQTILFLNRRGFSSLYLCRFCGETIRCPNCEVSLTYHKYGGNLLCHYCGFSIKPPNRCPACNTEDLKPYGFGTQRVVEVLEDLFPKARVERMDRDTMKRKGEVQQVLKRFIQHETDILVGTQMVTKGHDFPNVTLVGVISADLSLNYPDFRAGEVTFQLLSQVAGRTGRGNVPGKVIIQTFNPSHYAITATKDHNYTKFFSQEIALRQQVNYPPFSLIANVRFLGNSKTKTEKIATHIGMKIRNRLKKQAKRKSAVEVLGPVEAPMAKLKGKYRQQILIKSRTSRYLNQLLKEVETFSAQILSSSGVRMIIDVDPYQMM